MADEHHDANTSDVQKVRVGDEDDGGDVVGEQLPSILAFRFPQEYHGNGLGVEGQLHQVDDAFAQSGLGITRQFGAFTPVQPGVGEPGLGKRYNE